MITELITVLRQGEELTNAATWKNRQLAAGAVGAVLVGLWKLAHGFGFAPEVDADLANSLAAGIAAAYCLFNVFVTAATSRRVGLPARSGPDISPPTA